MILPYINTKSKLKLLGLFWLPFLSMGVAGGLTDNCPIFTKKWLIVSGRMREWISMIVCKCLLMRDVCHSDWGRDLAPEFIHDQVVTQATRLYFVLTWLQFIIIYVSGIETKYTRRL